MTRSVNKGFLNKQHVKVDFSASLVVYLIIVLGTSVFIALAPFIGGGISSLSVAGWIFLAVIFLPVLGTHLNWTHPLMLQIPFLAMQAFALIVAGCGYLPLQNPFLVIPSTNCLEDLYFKTSLVNTLGFFVMFCVCFWPSKNRSIKLRYVGVNLERRLGIVSIILLLLAWASYSFIVYKVGSISLMFLNMSNRLLLYHDLGYFIKITKFGIFSALLLLLRGNFFKATLVVFGQIFIAISLGDRGDVIFYTLIPLCIAWHYLIRPVTYKILFAGAILLLVFYQGMGAYRVGSVSERLNYHVDSQLLKILAGIEHHHNSAGVIYKVDRGEIPMQFGKPLTNLLLAPIPRVYWSEKPIIAESALVGAWLKKSVVISGLPPGIFGYGYLNFGWFGVVGFGLISGLCVSRFYYYLIGYYFENRMRSPNGNIVIYSIFAFLIANPLSTEVQISILMLLPPIFIIFAFCRSNKVN